MDINMDTSRGQFFVLEGIDASGKTEQFNRLVRRMRAASYNVVEGNFPRYKESATYCVNEYLQGRYRKPEAPSLQAMRASVLFAVDRYDAAEKVLQEALEAGNIVISNRYFASNLAHQGGKIENEKERKEFYRWLYDFEFRIMGIPKPDLNIVLHLPAAISYELAKKRAEATNKKRDTHESDLSHFEHTEAIYLEIARMFPDEFAMIECTERGIFLSRDEIESRIWGVVSKRLG
ncbi:MAG: deoxynucleoside kinase [bacterium]|nr:deoxynucleoside kinase [bacterium]